MAVVDAPGGEPSPEWRNFYGRRHGKTLRHSQKTYLAEDLAALTARGISHAENPDRAPFDPVARFGNRPFWIEVGFGGGEHLVHMASLYPEMFLLGCEPYVNGVAMLLGKTRAAGVTNLAIHPGDARDLFDLLPDGSVAKLFLNYPDPWPKARHHRRRFVNPDYLGPLFRVMAVGAELRVATDIADYVRQTLEQVPQVGFVRLDHPIETPWPDWISTRYEKKALREGRPPHYLTFRRP